MRGQLVRDENFTLFYGGPFSQWAPCCFVVDGVEYNCAEQYMMAQKARMFGDGEMLRRIMATSDPSVQKGLGKQVTGFDRTAWEAVARDIVARGSLAKFTSSHRLLGELMRTHDTTLVEASPTDRIWGIGLAEHDERCRSRDAWRGTNWLGQVLTDVREHLHWIAPYA